MSGIQKRQNSLKFGWFTISVWHVLYDKMLQTNKGYKNSMH